jgi:hypothetical protein
MTSTKDMPDRAVLVAIGIAKQRNGILIEIPGRTRRRQLTILNTRADHDRLVAIPAGFEQPVVAGFEGQTMGLAATTIARWRIGCVRRVSICA